MAQKINTISTLAIYLRVIGVLFVIAGIAIGIYIGRPQPYTYEHVSQLGFVNEETGYTDFNFIYFIICTLSGFISGFIMYGFAKIVNAGHIYVEEAREKYNN